MVHWLVARLGQPKASQILHSVTSPGPGTFVSPEASGRTQTRPGRTFRRPWWLRQSLERSRALRNHRAQVPRKLRSSTRCRVSRRDSRVAHRSCSRRTPLISVTTSAPSAAVLSSLQCVFNVCTVVVRTRLQVHCECVVRSNLTKPFEWEAQPARVMWDQSRLSCVHAVQERRDRCFVLPYPAV